MRTLWIIALSWLLGCGDAPTTPAPPPPLVFGLLPTESSVDAERRWGPLLAHIALKTGREVQPLSVVDYAALVEAMRFGKADLGYLGPLAYILAHERAGVIPIAQEVPAEGEAYYHGLIVAKQERAAGGLDALRGGSFAFVEPNSTSGYLVPLLHFIDDRGLRPEAFFGEVRFAGSHQAVLLQVRLGHVDAGATNDLDLRRAIEAGHVKEGELATLWTSAPIPGSPIVVRKDLDPALLESIRGAILGYADPVGLTAMQVRGFVAVTDATYAPVRRLEALRDEGSGK